jgi:hypothetical protein
MDGMSPLRNKNMLHQEFIPSFQKPKSAMGYRDAMNFETDRDDELRMKAMLNAAMDSREDLFPSPILRASSTPPTRLLNRNVEDITDGVNQIDLEVCLIAFIYKNRN